MRTTKCAFFTKALTIVIALTTLPAVAQTPAMDWREQYAYTLGVQAYLYAFPWAYMPEARWLRTEPVNRQANRFAHARKLADARLTIGGGPNNDALYSRAVI